MGISRILFCIVIVISFFDVLSVGFVIQYLLGRDVRTLRPYRKIRNPQIVIFLCHSNDAFVRVTETNPQNVRISVFALVGLIMLLLARFHQTLFEE